LHERMKEAVNHVTETWDYTKPENWPNNKIVVN
jgi:hypothetical protein